MQFSYGRQFDCEATRSFDCLFGDWRNVREISMLAEGRESVHQITHTDAEIPMQPCCISSNVLKDIQAYPALRLHFHKRYGSDDRQEVGIDLDKSNIDSSSNPIHAFRSSCWCLEASSRNWNVSRYKGAALRTQKILAWTVNPIHYRWHRQLHRSGAMMMKVCVNLCVKNQLIGDKEDES